MGQISQSTSQSTPLPQTSSALVKSVALSVKYLHEMYIDSLPVFKQFLAGKGFSIEVGGGETRSSWWFKASSEGQVYDTGLTIATPEFPLNKPDENLARLVRLMTQLREGATGDLSWGSSSRRETAENLRAMADEVDRRPEKALQIVTTLRKSAADNDTLATSLSAKEGAVETLARKYLYTGENSIARSPHLRAHPRIAVDETGTGSLLLIPNGISPKAGSGTLVIAVKESFDPSVSLATVIRLLSNLELHREGAWIDDRTVQDRAVRNGQSVTADVRSRFGENSEEYRLASAALRVLASIGSQRKA